METTSSRSTQRCVWGDSACCWGERERDFLSQFFFLLLLSIAFFLPLFSRRKHTHRLTFLLLTLLPLLNNNDKKNPSQVKITGNNRTKQKLIGLNATVKKSVGLGGWHWLVLENGKEVKLQKNALEVVSLPTGEEVESIEFQTKDDDDGSHVESGEIEELDGDEEMNEDEDNNEREGKDGGDAMDEDDEKAGSKEQDGEEDEEKKEGEGDGEDGEGEEEEEEGEEVDKEGGMKARLRRPTRTPGNGPPSQQAAAAMKRIVDKRNAGKPNCNVNFNRLTGPTLLKYKKFYQMPGADTDDVIKGKAKMVDEVTRHFMSQKVDEQKCLAQFIASLASTTR